MLKSAMRLPSVYSTANWVRLPAHRKWTWWRQVKRRGRGCLQACNATIATKKTARARNVCCMLKKSRLLHSYAPTAIEIVDSSERIMPKPKQEQNAIARCFSVIDGRHDVSMPMAFCAALPPRMLVSELPLLAPISDLKSKDMTAACPALTTRNHVECVARRDRAIESPYVRRRPQAADAVAKEKKSKLACEAEQLQRLPYSFCAQRTDALARKSDKFRRTRAHCKTTRTLAAQSSGQYGAS